VLGVIYFPSYSKDDFKTGNKVLTNKSIHGWRKFKEVLEAKVHGYYQMKGFYLELDKICREHHDHVEDFNMRF